MARNKLVLVEYTEDHDANFRRDDEDSGKATFEKGTRRRVDARSAASLVKAKKAKIVGDADEKAEAREAVKAVDVPPAGGN